MSFSLSTYDVFAMYKIGLCHDTATNASGDNVNREVEPNHLRDDGSQAPPISARARSQGAWDRRCQTAGVL